MQAFVQAKELFCKQEIQPKVAFQAGDKTERSSKFWKIRDLPDYRVGQVAYGSIYGSLNYPYCIIIFSPLRFIFETSNSPFTN